MPPRKKTELLKGKHWVLQLQIQDRGPFDKFRLRLQEKLGADLTNVQTFQILLQNADTILDVLFIDKSENSERSKND